MEDFQLHPQLQADTYHLARLPHCHLLLHRNAALHWFILVPDTGKQDLFDLPPDQRAGVLLECERVAGYLKQELGYPKINFAAIGNLVPQLHLHLVGRRPDDPCWPKPVWGNLQPGPEYTVEQIEGLRRMVLESPVKCLR